MSHRHTLPVPTGLGVLFAVLAGPILGTAMGAQAPSYGPVFRHAALEYMSSRQFPRVELEVGGSIAVQAVRLCFRAQQARDFYYVEMARQKDSNRFVAVLPIPLIETATVIYYFDVTDTNLRRFVSSQFQAKVTAGTVATSYLGENPTLKVNALNSGVPTQPPGFRPDGVVKVPTAGPTTATPGSSAPPPPVPPKTPPTGPSQPGSSGSGVATPGKASGGGGGGAAVGVVLGLGAAGAGAYFLTRNKEEPVPPRADLAVTIATTPAGPIVVNVPFSFVIQVSNRGPDRATNVILTDTLPSSVSILGATPSGATCNTSGTTETCNAASLPAGGSFSLDIRVRPTVIQSSVVNNCSVTATETDPDQSNNSNGVTFSVQRAPGRADIAVTQTVVVTRQYSSPPYYHIVYRFTVGVQNLGPTDSVADIDLDVAITGVTIPQWSLVKGSIQPSSPMRDCSTKRAQSGSLFGCTTALAPKQQANVTFDIDASCCGTFSSTAHTLVCEKVDPDCSNNTSSLPVSVITFRDAGRAPADGMRTPDPGLSSSLTAVLLSSSAETSRGSIALNGLYLGTVDTSSPLRVPFPGKPGPNLVEARLLSASTETLVWQFDFDGTPGLVPGSLVVESGAPTALGDRVIAFRLGQTPDSVIRFRFSLAE